MPNFEKHEFQLQRYIYTEKAEITTITATKFEFNELNFEIQVDQDKTVEICVLRKHVTPEEDRRVKLLRIFTDTIMYSKKTKKNRNLKNNYYKDKPLKCERPNLPGY